MDLATCTLDASKTHSPVGRPAFLSCTHAPDLNLRLLLPLYLYTDTELIDPMCIEDYVGQGILKEVIEASERS